MGHFFAGLPVLVANNVQHNPVVILGLPTDRELALSTCRLFGRACPTTTTFLNLVKRIYNVAQMVQQAVVSSHSTTTALVSQF